MAQFNKPAGLAMDPSGNIYVADELNHRIRKISSNGVVTTIAGIGIAGHNDGSLALSKFRNPTGISYDKITGNLYVADRMNHCIRMIKINGVFTVAGVPGAPGYVNGTASLARFQKPYDVQVHTENANLYIADAGNHTIRKVDEIGVVSTFAGDNQPGQTDGLGMSARFNKPVSITFDSAGYFFVADAMNHSIRRISLLQEVQTVAGNGVSGFADGVGSFAQFNTPMSIAIVDSEGLICDTKNNRIRGFGYEGFLVSTFAGSSASGLVNGLGTQSRFDNPVGIVKDDSGNYYVSDAGNHVIRKVIVE